MPTSNEFRQKAEECFSLANEATTETDRLACLDLARTWLEAAARQDEMTPDQIVDPKKLDLDLRPKSEAVQPHPGWRERLLGLFR